MALPILLHEPGRVVGDLDPGERTGLVRQGLNRPVEPGGPLHLQLRLPPKLEVLFPVVPQLRRGRNAEHDVLNPGSIAGMRGRRRRGSRAFRDSAVWRVMKTASSHATWGEENRRRV